jgi:hypothetical protein
MSIERETLYRLPWSKNDNAGGWVEVTDKCDLHCPGCYRHRLEGHRPLDEVKEDILLCQKLTNCDRMAVAGGEPLLYPDILEVIDFIRSHNMKPVLLTNGRKLTWDLANNLREAGLAKYHFHVDSGQNRPGYQGKNESEMNDLRQYFADLCWDVGGVQCGYNITISRSSLPHLPAVVDWARKNIHKVQHVSLIAFRAIPISEQIRYEVNVEKIDPSCLQHITRDKDQIDITSKEMFALLEDHYHGYKATTYLNGTADPETLKFLVTINIGSPNQVFGIMGPKSVEIVQNVYHLLKGRYCAFAENARVGKKLFLLSLIDRDVRRAFFRFARSVFQKPHSLTEKIYIQSISLQQPNEYLNGVPNLCDGCMNMMVYKGKLVHSCRLDEYRIFGGLLTPIIENRIVTGTESYSGLMRQIGQKEDI